MYNFSVSQALPVAFAFDVSNVPGTDLSTVPSATSTTEAASVDTGLAQPAQDSFAFLFDAADGSATVSDSTSSQTRTFGSGETTLSFDWSGNQGSSWIPGSGWGGSTDSSDGDASDEDGDTPDSGTDTETDNSWDFGSWNGGIGSWSGWGGGAGGDSGSGDDTNTGSDSDDTPDTGTDDDTDTGNTSGDSTGGGYGGTERFPGLQEFTIMHDGVERTYTIDVPESFDPENPEAYSAVFLFHGLDASAEGMPYTGMSDAGEDNDFIAIYPNAVDGSWNLGSNDNEADDIGFVLALIDELVENWNVDASSLFAAGHSQGGYFAQHLADEMPEVFNAYGIVTANMPELSGENTTGEDAPMIFFHSTEDPYLDYEGTTAPNGNTYGGAEATVQYWAAHNDTTMGEFTDVPDIADDGMTTQMRVSEDGSVVHYVTEGDSHGWPGSDYWNAFTGEVTEDIDATEIMVEFFADYGL